MVTAGLAVACAASSGIDSGVGGSGVDGGAGASAAGSAGVSAGGGAGTSSGGSGGVATDGSAGASNGGSGGASTGGTSGHDGGSEASAGGSGGAAGSGGAGGSGGGCTTGSGPDGGCAPFRAKGSEWEVCNGSYEPPTLALGAGKAIIGCMPSGSQNVTPVVKMFDETGQAVGSPVSLRTSDGYYFTDIALTFENSAFQAVHSYNCTDRGGYSVGWGWNCIEFRQFSTSGAAIGTPLVFGNDGNNAHPVVAWNGSGFAAAWVSYKNAYFRRIDASGKLVGAGGTANTLIGSTSIDARDGSRTAIAYDAGADDYGVFILMDTEIDFMRVGPDGSVEVPLVRLGPAYSQEFQGLFSAESYRGNFYVGFTTGSEIHFDKVSPSGEVLFDNVIATTDYAWTTTFLESGVFYMTIDDGAHHAVLDAIDPNGQIVASKSGTLDPNRVMDFSKAAYDPSTHTLVVAYRDASKNIRAQAFDLVP